MNEIIAVAMEYRQLDVAVAVCLLLSVAFLLIRFVWQPARRLWIIEWALMGGLLLAIGWIFPWQQFSLGVLGANQEPLQTKSDSLSSDHRELPALVRKVDAGAFGKAGNNIEPSGSAFSKTAGDATRLNEIHAKIAPSATTSLVAIDSQSGRWPKWILGAYALGAIGMILWLIAGQWTVHRLVRRASQPSLELLNAWPQLQEEMRLAIGARARPQVRLLISTDLSHPVAVGIVRPAVLLPQWLLQSCTAEQLRPVLAHEAAHVMRRDAALRWLAAVFQVLFFYQPLYWWLRHELRLCQEYLADAHAAAWARSTPEYAEQLVSLFKAAPVGSRRPLPGLSILEGRSDLYRRIQMLVHAPRKLELNGIRGWNLATAAALVSFSLSLGLVTLRADTSAAPPDKVAKRIDNGSESPNSDAASKPAGPEFRFHVVNKEGKPVAGAKVQPWACVLRGSHGSAGLDEKLFPATTTDADGLARIVFQTTGTDPPHQILRKLFDQGIERLALKVEHPDHPSWAEYVEVDDRRPIVLENSSTIEVQVRREHDNGAPSRLYPALGASTLDWSAANGRVTIRRVDLHGTSAAQWLRIVQVPENEPAWFSDLIDLKGRAGNPIAIDATLKPGVRVEGQLAAEVPRPVKNGRVVAAIVDGGYSNTNWYWESTATIAADGTFVFESLPADETLLIVALCDGWVSSDPTPAEIKEHNLDLDRRMLDGTTVFPKAFRLKAPLIKPEIEMRRTAMCEVTVIDEKNQPISNAMVMFFPNQVFYHSGSNIVGQGDDRLTQIRKELATGKQSQPSLADQQKTAFAYSATTDKRGVAVVRNLPAPNEATGAGGNIFLVQREGYTTTGNIPSADYGLIGAPLFAKLSAGKKERMTVHMHKVVAEQEAALPEVNEDELAGRVVDERGVPLEGVKVLVWERDDEKIRSDKDGRFRKKIETTNGDEKHLVVRLMKPGFAPYLVVDWRLGLKNQTVVMETKTYFEGTVSGPDGKPAANVLIRANQGPKQDNPAAVIGEIWTETRTDAAGRYKLLVQPDSYAFDVRAPGIGAARVPKDGEKGDVFEANSNLLPQRPKIVIGQNEIKKLDIRLDSGVDFRAKVVDAATGRPVPKVRLWHWQYPGIEGRTNDQGIVTIPAMPSGEFRFMIEAPAAYVQGWSDQIPDRWKKLVDEYNHRGSSKLLMSLDEGLPFDLLPGMPEVTIALEPGVTISGRVLDPNGKPVAGATVAPVRSGKGHSLTGDTRFSVATKAGGEFTVVLPPSNGEKYNLMAHDGEYQKWRNWANGIGPVLETKSGQKLDDVELRLNRPGTIRGRTVDERGQPLANVYVQTTAADRLENNYYNPATRSDKNGQFELRFVRPGRHLVHGWMLVDNKAPQEDTKFPVVDVKSGEAASVGDLYIPVQDQDRQ